MYEVRGGAVLQLQARRQGWRRAHGLHRPLLIALALASCGRVSFEARTDGGDADGDGGTGGVKISIALPGGGQMRDLAIAPSDNKLYALAFGGAMFRYDTAWVRCGSVEGIDAIEVDTTGVVWSASEFEVYRSVDSCATWTPTLAPTASLGIGVIGATVYHLGDAALWEWGGTSWTQVPTPVDGTLFSSFDGHPASGLRVVGTYNYIVVSPDGTNWTQETVGLATDVVVDVGVADARAYVLTGATATGVGNVACSFDGNGATWMNCLSSGGTAMALDPTSDQHVVVATYDEMGETTNAFGSFTAGLRAAGGMDDAIVRDIEFQSTGGVFVASDRGVFGSFVRPIQWMPFLDGLDAWTINDIIRAGTDVYVSTDAGVMRSTDGMPFTLSTVGTQYNTQASRIAVAPNGTLIAPGRSIWASTDKGATWTQAQSFDDLDGYYGHMAAFVGSRAFVSTIGGRVHHADPPYTSWTIATPGGGDEIYALDGAGTELYLGTKLGLLRTTLDVAPAVAVDTITAKCFGVAKLQYGGMGAACEDGIWLSDATRSTWNQSLPGLEFHEIALVPDGRIIALGFDSGIYVTSDRGMSWQAVALPNVNPLSAIYDEADDTLVVGTAGFGLLRVALP